MVARDTWFWETHLAIGNPRDFDRRCMCNIDFMKRAVITELGYKSEILYLSYFGYFHSYIPLFSSHFSLPFPSFLPISVYKDARPFGDDICYAPFHGGGRW